MSNSYIRSISMFLSLIWISLQYGCSIGMQPPEETQESMATLTARVDVTTTMLLEESFEEHTRTPSFMTSPTYVPIDWTANVTEVLGGDYLFEQSFQDCVLPCWGTLVPGETGLSDVQFAFANILEFSTNENILDLPLPDKDPFPPLSEETTTIAYDSKALITFKFNRPPNTLHLITFISRGEVYPNLSPRRVIEKFGTPDVIRIGFQLGQQGVADGDLQLLYSRGIMFYYSGLVEVSQTSNDMLPKAGICLDDQMEVQVVALMEPFENNLMNLNSFQDQTINFREGRYPVLENIEARIGISPQELTEQLANDPNFCLYGEMPTP